MYTYLASPYTGTKEEEEDRFQKALAATASLLRRKIAVYSPIVHCHQMHLAHKLPGTYEFCAWYNTIMITQAKYLAILTISGWDKSEGVWEEFWSARDMGLPVVFYSVVGDEVEQVSDKEAQKLVTRLHGVHSV